MTSQPIEFSLNHMVCPGFSAEELLDAAAKLGVGAVELRNDVQSNSVTELEQAKGKGSPSKLQISF